MDCVSDLFPNSSIMDSPKTVPDLLWGSDPPSEDADEQRAIVYVDFDNRSHFLSYKEVQRISSSLSSTLSSARSSKNEILVPIRAGKLSINFPIVVLFGDCRQYAPVFMLGANSAGLPFMSLDDSLQSFHESRKILKDKLLLEPFGFVIFHHSIQNIFCDCVENDLKSWEFTQLPFSPEFILATYVKCDDAIFEPSPKKLKLSNENEEVEPEVAKAAISYVIKTSGTSSRGPKMVFVTHESIISNIISFSNIFKDISKTDILVCSPFTFDPSLCDLFLGLYLRCSVCLISSTVRSNSEAFLRLFTPNVTLFLNRFNHGKTLLDRYPSFTYMTVTPSLWRQRFSPFFIFKNLKYLNFGGENSPTIRELKPVCENNPKLTITNLYGLTEMSVWATIFTDSRAFIKKCKNLEQTLPIGEPILETELQRLNPDNRELTILSERRKCLILSQNEFTFDNQLKTGDIFVKNVISQHIFFDKRCENEDFVKINGKKCYLLDVKKKVFELLEDCDILEQVLVVPASFNSMPNSVIVIILCFNSKFVDFEDVTTRIFDHFVAKGENRFPIRIRFIRSNQLLPLTKNGKLDLKGLSALDLKSEEFFRYLDDNSLIQILSFTLKKILLIDETLVEEAFKMNTKLSQLGVDSVGTVQIALHFEQLFSCTIHNFYQCLLKDSIQDILKFLKNFLATGTFPHLFLSAEMEPPSTQSKDVEKETTAQPKEIEIEPNKIEEKKILSLESQWKFCMQECVDASPLLVKFEEYSLVIVASHSGMVAALVVSDGRLFWEHNTNSRVLAAPVVSVDEELVFIGAYDGHVHGLEVRTGIHRWDIPTGGQIKVSCLDIGERLFIPSYDCHLYYYRYSAMKQPKFCWRRNVANSPISSPPVKYSTGTFSAVLVGTLCGTVAAIDYKLGEIMWKFQTSSIPIFSKPSVWGFEIILPLANNNLISLRGESGDFKWNFKTDQSNFSSPILFINKKKMKEYLLFGALDGFSCFVLNDQKLLWKIETGSNCRNYVQWDEDRILIIDISGQAYIVNMSGEYESVKMYQKATENEMKIGAQVFSTPVIDHKTGNVIFGARDNFVHCFQAVYKSVQT